MSESRQPLAVGLRHRLSLRVTESLTVPSLPAAFTGFHDMPPVLATPFLVGFVEWTCVEALRPFLSPEQTTVGTRVDLSHVAATPVGLSVTAEVELVEVAGRCLRFKVLCRDELDVISSGFHERALVDRARFMARVQEKRAQGH